MQINTLAVSFNDAITAIDNFVWGWPLIILILAAGIWLSIRVGFIQVKHLGKALKYMVKNESNGEGDVTSFGALCTALSATIGTGNIVGVATAICLGGPGALFWMLIAAFFGMATKYSEGFLAIRFREKKDGHFLGGPFYYIEKGMGAKWKWLAKLFAVFGVLAGLLGIGTITQINGITSAIKDFFDPGKTHIAFTIGENAYSWATVIGGIVVTACVALVVIGGIKAISKVSEIVVPFMAITYVVFVLIIFFRNISEVPNAIKIVFTTAFGIKPVVGGFVGEALKVAMQNGIGKGIFSNEAGLGSAPIAAAAAQTKDTVRQGLVTMTGTFIDTIVICTLTGLSIILTGAYNSYDPDKDIVGVKITTIAWQKGLPWDSQISAFVLMVCLAFFAFTTILGWDYYSEKCIEYLTGKQKYVKAFKYVYILAVFIGPYLTVEAVWKIANIFNGLMALPNLVALFALSGLVGKETKAYFANKNHDLKELSKNK